MYEIDILIKEYRLTKDKKLIEIIQKIIENVDVPHMAE